MVVGIGEGEYEGDVRVRVRTLLCRHGVSMIE